MAIDGPVDGIGLLLGDGPRMSADGSEAPVPLRTPSPKRRRRARGGADRASATPDNFTPEAVAQLQEENNRLRRQLIGHRLAAGRARATVVSAISANTEAAARHADALNTRGALRAGSHVVVKKVNLKGTRSARGRGKETKRAVAKLEVRGVAVAGSGKAGALPAACRLQMAFSKDSSTSTKAIARKFEVHPNTVRRNRMSTAALIYGQQQVWLHDLASLCQDHPPTVCCVGRKWDETKEKLSVKLFKKACRARTRKCTSELCRCVAAGLGNSGKAK